MSTRTSGRWKSMSIFWNKSPLIKLITMRFLLSKYTTAMLQQRSPVFIPTELRIDMKFGGHILNQGGVRAGADKASIPRRKTFATLSGENYQSVREFSLMNAFIYCTNYEQLSLILPRKIIDSYLHVKSKRKLFLVSCCDYSFEK